jgi:hypothetical protein
MYSAIIIWKNNCTRQDHLPLGEIKKLLKITNIPLAPLLARDFA